MSKLESRLRCEEHDCPKIRVDGDYYCVIEYLDAHLGGSQVTDIVPGEPQGRTYMPTRLVFSDGHTLPLYCPDCGQAHEMEVDADTFLDDVADLYLIGFAYLPVEEEEPEGVELIFSEDPDLDPEEATEENSDALFIHLRSVQELTCPGGADHAAPEED